MEKFAGLAGMRGKIDAGEGSWPPQGDGSAAPRAWRSTSVRSPYPFLPGGEAIRTG
jgi:hypothetical protein